MKIAFVGEGDFSFTYSLSQSFLGIIKPHEAFDGQRRFIDLNGDIPIDNIKVFPTSYDSHEDLMAKYPQTDGYIKFMSKSPHFCIKHGVNAWKLSESFEKESLTGVIWNHPHIGIEDCSLHSCVLSHFYYSAQEVIAPQGFIQIMLLSGQIFRWDAIRLAQEQGLEVVDCFLFDSSHFPHFESKRNERAQSFKNGHVKRHHLLSTGSNPELHGGLDSWVLRFKRKHMISASEKKKGEDGERDLEDFLMRKKGESNADRNKLLGDEILVTWESIEKDGKKKKHKDEGPSVYRCGHCSKVFGDMRGIKNHIISQHKPIENEGDDNLNKQSCYNCVECGKSYADETALQQHQISRHSGVFAGSKLSYDLSRMTKKRSSILNCDTLKSRDITSAADGLQDDNEECKACGRMFEKGNYEQHLMSLIPTVSFDIPCENCGKMFKEQRALRQHLNFCK